MFTIHCNFFLEITTVYLKSFKILIINRVADKNITVFQTKGTAKIKQK